jgi:colanic acid biosynthesis glycosyl transferase WcaI
VKILYVSQYFPPEMGAPAARASELAFHWARMGHEVTVLTGFPNHPTGEVHPDYRGKLRRLVMRETTNGATVVRTWLLPFPNRGSLRRMANYASFCISAAATGMFVRRPDVVIATSPQLLVGLSGWWIARVKRLPFVFEVRDLWPESLAAVGMGDADSVFHRALEKIAGFLYRNCQRVVVVTPAFKDHLIRHWGVAAERISVVENGVEADLFCAGPPDTALKSQLGADGKFVVGYIGTMGMAHGLGTLLEAAAKLRNSAPHISFLLVGEGAEKERILAASRDLENVKVLGQQPREKIPDYIRACDVCLVSLKKTELFKTVIPTKMLEFMSCGRPVIVAVEGEARRIIEQAGAGLFIPPENTGALCEAVLTLSREKGLCDEFGRNGRNAILQKFSRGKTAADYITELERVACSQQRKQAAAV